MGKVSIKFSVNKRELAYPLQDILKILLFFANFTGHINTG